MTAANDLFTEIVDVYRKLVYFPQEWTYKLTALFVLQTWMKPAISTAWYICFAGPKESGKTTALEVTMALSRNGTLSNNISPAALARIAETDTLFVDELDELKDEARTVAEGILRAGYRVGVPYIRCEGPKNEVHKYDVFGPKGYSMRGEVEDALTSRTYIAWTEKVGKERMADMLIANQLRDFRSLKERLGAWATDATIGDLKVSISALWDSKTFRNRVAHFVENNIGPRDIELLTSCLAFADGLGIDIEGEATQAMEDQATYITSETDEFREELYLTWMSMGKPKISTRRDLREALNLARATRKEASIGQKSFPRLLREAGARDTIEIRRTHGRNMFYFSPDFLLRIAPQDEGAQSEMAHPELRPIAHPDKITHPESKGVGAGWVHNKGGDDAAYGRQDGGLESPQITHPTTLSAPPSESRRRFLEDLAKKEIFTEQDLAEKAAVLGIAASDVRKTIEAWDGQNRIVHIPGGKLRLIIS